MNDEQQLLASAYLDGALTNEERARAEADPEVMAAVEQLRELRRALSVVDPPNPARRDAAINAALGVFEAERAPAAPPPARSRVGRRTNTWFIGAAAAALLLVVAGGILATRSNDQGGGEDSAGGGAAATSAVRGQVLNEASGGAESTGGTEQSTEARSSGDQQDSGAAPGTAAVAATPTAPESTTFDAAHVPRPAADLRQIATTLLTEGRPATERAPRCDGGQFLGRHVLTIRGKGTSVEIFYNRRSRQYIALDARTCEPLISTSAQ